MKKLGYGFLLLSLAVLIILMLNTSTFESKQITVDQVTIEIPESPENNLAEAIKFKTVSYEDTSKLDTAEFHSFHKFLKSAYPLIDSLIPMEKVNESLLYKWDGTNKALNPIILMSHQDVVPVDENTLDQWEVDPFKGEIKDGMVWGRGAMDDKVSLIAIMEAVEFLISKGFEPARTIYMAFGHDEEVGGPKGAGEIAKLLQSRGVKAELVIDEGGYVVDKLMSGIDKSLALINVAEKGFVSFKITVNTSGGHSSSPPVDNTIGLLTRAINRLEENQFEYKLVEPINSQMKYMGPELPFLQKVVFANPWLFGGTVAKAMNAHTTTAPTIIQGGMKANVIPTTAWAIMNFRILPGENIELIHEHVVNIINDDRFTIEIDGSAKNPSPVSTIESPAFELIAKTIKQSLGETIVAPGLLGGGTDATHFYSITNNVYRFLPMRINPENLTGFHGINESITIDNYHEIVRFFVQLIRNCNEL
jgi:carboxypeptidase PM20D1